MTMLNNYWRSAMRLPDFMESDVATATNQYNLLGSYTVPAGQLVGLGFGELHGQQDAQGRIYVDLQDAGGVAVNGQLQLAIYDAADHPILITDEFRTEQLRTNSSDRTKQVPFPFENVMVSRDNKINVYFKPDANVTVSATKSNLLMDCTKGKGN